MSLFILLTVIQALVAAALVGVVLMQRSEGGGLGIGGGSPSGAFGARGAADFLSRATKWLAIAFVSLSIVLAALAVRESNVGEVTTTLDRDAPAASTLPDVLGEAAPAQAPTPPAGEVPAPQPSAAPAPTGQPAQ